MPLIGRKGLLATIIVVLGAFPAVVPGLSLQADAANPLKRVYPTHTSIIATTFWVGEIFDPGAADGSQMMSTYDSQWYRHYGGCDGVKVKGVCKTEVRKASNGYFPTATKPLQNPFYLDLPFDDINDPTGFATRGTVIPWANDPGYAGRAKDRNFSFMKNRWVQINRAGRTCYGQVQDAGPGKYHDASYVFGSSNRRPANTSYNNAGMDVSPALNGCLGFASLDGQSDKVGWRFVEAANVPTGPWKKIVTTRGVSN